MKFSNILKWLVKIVDYLVLNKDLIRAYLNRYKGETFFSLADRLAKGFIKQEATTILTDYLDSICKKTGNKFMNFCRNIFSRFKPCLP